MKTEAERQKCIEVLETFSLRLEKTMKRGGDIRLDWQACGVLWAYLSPAVEMLKTDAAPIVSSNGQNSAEQVDEGTAIHEYNSYRDNKEAYLNKEHPEWMEQQYGKMCQKCGFRHFPRPECPGEA